MSVGWNLNDSITFLLPNTSFPLLAKWLHSTKMCRTIKIHWQCSHWRGGSLHKIYEWVRCVWPIRQRHKFTLSSMHCLYEDWPVSQNRLDRIKFARSRTIPISVPNGKNILGDMVFQISVGYTSIDTRQIQSRLGSRVCLFSVPNANMAGYATKSNYFIGKI